VKTINTSLKNYKTDIGVSELEKQIEILKQKAALPCIYAFIDIKREFVPNGFLYIGQSKSIKNRMLNYKGIKSSEILLKLQKRFNLWDEYWGIDCGNGMIGHPSEEKEEKINKLREFIEDPTRCGLKIQPRRKHESEETRKKYERLYINRYYPFLNKEPWKGGWRRNHRKFYMNQMHPEKNQRSKFPVHCLHTGEVFREPSETEIRNLNKQKYDSKIEGIKIDLMLQIKAKCEQKYVKKKANKLVL
tara:strand:+ start:104 stop:841 length:738 start_codon:yes stop_codon:yes gene_type:complete